jgi:hypothetical protein
VSQWVKAVLGLGEGWGEGRGFDSQGGQMFSNAA